MESSTEYPRTHYHMKMTLVISCYSFPSTPSSQRHQLLRPKLVEKSSKINGHGRHDRGVRFGWHTQVQRAWTWRCQHFALTQGYVISRHGKSHSSQARKNLQASTFHGSVESLVLEDGSKNAK